ncbi:VOC family protein [Sutcliffiella deserti]|uniref:VOC family protein n=1 Tax=Sutcliffiella deserti TaxID=2875501 RepID=UPI001CC07333|nr:VOC family protein [Sutcliffiella deserti]
MIKIEDFHHISLSVTDIEASKHFYGKILGFAEIKRPDFGFPGAWYQIGSAQLHLIQNSKAETLRESSKLDSRDGHFAIRVKSYDQTLQFLKENKIEVLEKPNSKSGFAQIFCSDPDHNLIEFNVEQS